METSKIAVKRRLYILRQLAPHLVLLSSRLQIQTEPSHPSTHASHRVSCITHLQWLSGGAPPAAWPPLSQAPQRPSPLASAARTRMSQVDSWACFDSSARRHARGMAKVRPLLRRHLLLWQYSIPSACICSAPKCAQLSTGHCVSPAHHQRIKAFLGL